MQKKIGRAQEKLTHLGRMVLFLSLILLSGCAKSNSALYGYVEGQFTYISVNYPGILRNLFVDEGYAVRKGQLLFILEPEPQQNQLRQAAANLSRATAERQVHLATYENAVINFKRQAALLLKKATSKAEYDNAYTSMVRAKKQIDADDQNIAALTAALANAQWTSGQKVVTAVKAGVIYNKFHLVGEYIPVGQPVLSLLTPEDIKAVFFVSETQLGKVHLGQQVKIRCDGCSSLIPARITYISPKAEYTPPVIYSDNQRAKLVFRIKATPPTKDAYALHPGQPIDVYLMH